MTIHNRGPFRAYKPNYRIEAKKNETTIYIYDEIGWFGISAEQIVKDINAVEGGTINLRINSPGGSVFDGLSIFNAIKQHKAKTISHIDGLAASISSIIPLASDEIIMASNAFYMIHDPWGLVIGSAEDMRKEADLLEKVAGSLVDTYVNNSEKTEKEIRAFMADETWFTADEALKAGFIDKVFEAEEDTEAKAELFDLSIFANVPDQLTNKPKDINARDLESALRDAGCSRSQAKEILAKGFEPQDVRDAQIDIKPPLRDAEPVIEPEDPKPKRDKVSALLIKAEIMAPSKSD